MMEVRACEWKEAEAFAGQRLDRRRSYAIGPDFDDKKLILLSAVSWTQSCSGCFSAGEYGGMASYYSFDGRNNCHIGIGCHECGYHGKVRCSMWAPHSWQPAPGS
jgi:hypothetical protein